MKQTHWNRFFTRCARHLSWNEFTLKFCSSILRRINVVSIPNNQCLSPLLVLEQLCRRTGAWCSALRRVSRFTGVSLTGVTGSETPLPGSLAGSGGDSMLCFLLELLLLVYHDAPWCDSAQRSGVAMYFSSRSKKCWTGECRQRWVCRFDCPLAALERSSGAAAQQGDTVNSRWMDVCETY